VTGNERLDCGAHQAIARVAGAGIFNNHAPWRYLLISGLLPAIPIALLLPFVPESKVWQEKRAAGALKRPSFAQLFSPELRRTTLVTALLSPARTRPRLGACN